MQKLREDWLAENSDAREEGATKWQLENQIGHAKARSSKEPKNMDRLLDLAAAYGILDPCDKRCMNVLERLMATGVSELDTQRQGDAYQLFGRSLFLSGQYEKSLEALKKAQACFKEKGNFGLRRRNNTGLLRAYCALGRGREASERLEVALTLCEEQDDCIQLYVSAKQALEHTGCDRDREILDDIWYVFLDTHPEEKSKFEGYQGVGKGLARDFAKGEERQEDEVTSFAELWEKLKDPELYEGIIPEAIDLIKTTPMLRALFQFAMGMICLYVFLLIGTLVKGDGPSEL